MIHPHRFPRLVPRSSLIACMINGQPHDVLAAHAGDLVSLEADETLDVALTFSGPAPSAVIRPLRLGITPVIDGNTIRFRLPAPASVNMEFAGRKQFFLFARRPDPHRPSRDDPNVVFFEGGKVHEPGLLVLRDGQTAYLEAGAFVRGAIHAYEARQVRIAGYGVLDNSYWNYSRGEQTYTICTSYCEDVDIAGPVLINATAWVIVLGGSKRVAVRGVHQVQEIQSSDGIDVVGSEDVTIEDCCMYCGDDNVVLKSFTRPGFRGPLRDPQKAAAGEPTIGQPWDSPVRRITTRRCSLMNHRGGSATEIGYELRTELVEDVLFEDIDILAVHDMGSVFGLHNGDRARIRRVTWRNIRVDHHYDKLIDFRVLHSRWNEDKQRGYIEDVLLENIDVTISPYNPGYTNSLVGSYFKDHSIRGVTIRNLRYNGVKLTTLGELPLFQLNAEDVSIA